MLPIRPVLAAALAAATLALSGCAASADRTPSPPPSTAPGIATLSTDAPDDAGPNAALFARYGAPARYRLDMSDADADRALEPMTRCVDDVFVAAGLPKGVKPDDPTGAVAKRAADTCDPLRPLSAWEYDRSNPDSKRFIEAVIDCMRDAGVDGATIGTDQRGDFYPTGPGAGFDAAEKRCETTVPKG